MPIQVSRPVHDELVVLEGSDKAILLIESMRTW